MPWLALLFVTCYSLLILCIVAGNCTFLWLLLTSRIVRKTITLFTVSLVAADLAIGSVVVPTHASFVLSENWNPKDGDSICKVMTFAFLFAESASNLSLCGVTIERYIMIIFPLRYTTIKTVRRSYMAAAAVWIYSTVSASFVFAHLLDCFPTGHCGLSLPKNFMFVILFANYITPLVAMAVCYGHILKVSRRHRKQIAPNTVFSYSKATRRVKVHKASGTIFVLLTVFMISRLPIPVLNLVLKALHPSQRSCPEWTSITSQALYLLCFANSAANPLLCGYSNGPFKAAVKKHFQKHIEISSLRTEVARTAVTMKKKRRSE